MTHLNDEQSCFGSIAHMFHWPTKPTRQSTIHSMNESQPCGCQDVCTYLAGYNLSCAQLSSLSESLDCGCCAADEYSCYPNLWVLWLVVAIVLAGILAACLYGMMHAASQMCRTTYRLASWQLTTFQLNSIFKQAYKNQLSFKPEMLQHVSARAARHCQHKPSNVRT